MPSFKDGELITEDDLSRCILNFAMDRLQAIAHCKTVDASELRVFYTKDDYEIGYLRMEAAMAKGDTDTVYQEWRKAGEPEMWKEKMMEYKAKLPAEEQLAETEEARMANNIVPSDDEEENGVADSCRSESSYEGPSDIASDDEDGVDSEGSIATTQPDVEAPTVSYHVILRMALLLKYYYERTVEARRLLRLTCMHVPEIRAFLEQPINSVEEMNCLLQPFGLTIDTASRHYTTSDVQSGSGDSTTSL